MLKFLNNPDFLLKDIIYLLYSKNQINMFKLPRQTPHYPAEAATSRTKMSRTTLLNYFPQTTTLYRIIVTTSYARPSPLFP